MRDATRDGAEPSAGTAGPAGPVDSAGAAELDRARDVAGGVPDPEIPAVTLADLGILSGVRRDHDGRIVVTLTPTYTGCPATLVIRLDVEAALLGAGITNAVVETSLAPAWTTDAITPEGREKLRAYGIAPPPPRQAGAGARLFEMPEVACPRCGANDTERISEFGSTPCKALWRCRACAEPFDVFKCL